MPFFTVRVSTTLGETVDYIVDADDSDEAFEIATEQAREQGHRIAGTRLV